MKLRSSILLSFAFVVLLLFAPARAEAQTVVIVQASSLPRVDRAGNAVAKRPITQEPEGVSAQDCLDDLTIRVPLQLAGFQAQSSVQAWASHEGVDCSSQLNRQSGVARCWQVADAIAFEPTPRVNIRVRALLAGAVPGAAAAPDEVRACSRVDLTTLSLQFLYFAPGQPATAAGRAEVKVRADTVGDPPPGRMSIYPGDTSVEVQWHDPAAPASRLAINVYCAQIAPAAGDFTCASPSLPVGALPESPSEASFRCGGLLGSGSRAIVGSMASGAPLENGVTYGFALASVDRFGNIGPASSTVCESPRAGAELPSARERASDESSGCSASPARTSGGGVALGVLLALASAIARRRARSVASAQSCQ